MRYGIVGTGALGGFYGGMLARNGNDVHFLFHSDYDHVVANGLRVDSVSGNFSVPGKNDKQDILLNAYNKSADMPPCDIVLVCLKTINNNHLNKLLPPLLHEKSTVILVQNGIGMEAELAREFPELAIAGGMAFICATKKGPGHIEHSDFGELTIGGHVNVDPSVLDVVCHDLSEAGVSARITNDLNDFRWRKLVWNIPFNGMTVVMNTETNKLMEDPHMRGLVNDLMLEVIGAGNACGAAIEEEFAVKMMEYTDTMQPYKPSMKVDFDNGKQIEIEYIYSNPVRMAREQGYSMEKTSVIERQLLFLSGERK